MLKKFTAAVVLGAIVGAVAYKLKKEYEDQKALEHEFDMLSEVENDSQMTNETEENSKEDECSTEPKEESLNESTSEEEQNPVTDELNEDYKRILDEHSDSVILQLAIENDKLEEERPIQHFIDFKTEEDMEAFKEKVIEKGYVVTRGDNPNQLTVLHIAPINRSELLVNVYYLANQAIKHNGTYQGWQSRKVL
ncbi:MAG: ribonuclease E inhibitor RraB [Traorella sp.]